MRTMGMQFLHLIPSDFLSEVLYGELKVSSGFIPYELCDQKLIELIDGYATSHHDQVHLNLPLKYCTI